ncbi:hypothetical protein BPUM_3584 [Bacillus pumilus SAFR-032]|uniref:Uncharacterized protein n=1 Tax=Bacillus pumilus (strain SAFR-032) TaxID=315750 RepID=A8FJ11_BACP2|nr:hypothetical protein BPUM_3584 [Bacillus pumilus SAFR-032]
MIYQSLTRQLIYTHYFKIARGLFHKVKFFISIEKDELNARLFNTPYRWGQK